MTTGTKLARERLEKRRLFLDELYKDTPDRHQRAHHLALRQARYKRAAERKKNGSSP